MEQKEKQKEKEVVGDKEGPKRGTREFWVKVRKEGEESSESSSEDLSGEEVDWLDEEEKKKKVAEKEKKKEEREKKEKEREERRRKEEEEKKEKKEKMAKKKKEGSLSQSSGDLDVDKKGVEERIQEITLLRGKGKDPRQLVKQVLRLTNEKIADDQLFRVLTLQLNLLFDLSSSQRAADHWHKSISVMEQIMDLLKKRKDFEFTEVGTDEEQDNVSEDVEDGEKVEKPKEKKESKEPKDGKIRVVGSLVNFFETIEFQFQQSMQRLKPTSNAYLERFVDERALVKLARRLYEFFEERNEHKKVAYFAVVLMKYIHYKTYAATSEFFNEEDLKEFGGKNAPIRRYNRSKELERLNKMVLLHGDGKLRTTAILYIIYHRALQDQFYEARDLLLVTKIQDNIAHMDVPTQALYNRTNVQLGMCAFRQGMYEEAHSYLSDIYTGNKVKELLAQGVGKNTDEKTTEQIRAEKSRMLPPHMHIHLDLIEAFHLLSSVILEIPNMAANVHDINKKVISKYLRKIMQYWEDSEYKGPPESNKDFIVAAARALQKGDWQKAYNQVSGLRIWELVVDSERVKKVMEEKFKQVGLVAYLLTYSPYYDSISLSLLSEMFCLSPQKIQSTVAALILNKQLAASWDQPSKVLAIHHTEPTKLQYNCSQLTDRLAYLVENNERLLDFKTGAYGYKPEAMSDKLKNSSRYAASRLYRKTQKKTNYKK